MALVQVMTSPADRTGVLVPRSAAGLGWYAVLVAASWNAVLRPAVDIPITPYYLLMPLIMVHLIMKAPWAARRYSWLLIISIYGLLVGTIYGVPILMQITQLLKYIQLMTFLLLLEWLQRSDASARDKLNRLVVVLTALVFAIALIQLATGLEFPTVVNDESSLWLNTFFFTPNDVALFLCGGLCLVLASEIAVWKKLGVFALFVVFNIRNDAKAAVLGALLMVTMYGIVRMCAALRIKPALGLAVLLLAVPLGVICLGDNMIKVGEAEFDFAQLFMDPFTRIINLEPYGLGGSIFDRTDALIYSIQAWQSTHWLGLGPAGSVYTLSLPGSELLTAKSLHNAIAEVVVEFGPVAFLGIFLFFKPVFRAFWNSRPTRHQTGLMLLVAAAPMLAVSQSAGYISNYAFWLTAFLIWSTPPTKSGLKKSQPNPLQ